jgi:IS5 family transposase
MIAGAVPFESFRAEIEAAVLTPVSEKKSTAGRKPIDAMVMFRMLVLLSDEQVEYQVRDRLSFTRFLGLGIEDGIPDGTTLWLFRETLAEAGLIEKLFERFGQHLEVKGYIARGGQMVDATIVPVPKQRNSRDENDDVKAGKTPEAWEKNPAKSRQKDKDARWTKKHGKSFYGYKNHVNADAKHKLIRQYDVTDASVHDSQKFDGLLNQANASADVYADSRIARRRPRRSSACAAFAAGFISARTAIIRYRRRRRTRTAKRAKFGPVSSTCSVLNRTRRVVGSCGRSASRGRKPKSDCRTLPTTSAGW